MIGVKERQETYVWHLAEIQSRRGAQEPAWLRVIRKAALDRFEELGFPTPRVEEWKYTNVAPLTKIPFRPAAEYLAPLAIRQPKDSFPASSEQKISLHFYNGQYVAELTPVAAGGKNQ